MTTGVCVRTNLSVSVKMYCFFFRGTSDIVRWVIRCHVVCYVSCVGVIGLTCDEHSMRDCGPACGVARVRRGEQIIGW